MSDLLPIRTILNCVTREALAGRMHEEVLNGNSGHRVFSTKITLSDETILNLLVSFRGTIPTVCSVNVQMFNDDFVYNKPMDMGSYIGIKDPEYPNIPVYLSKPTLVREVHKLLKESRSPATLCINAGSNPEDVEATLVRFMLEQSDEPS